MTPTYVCWPPSSCDDWQFLTAGVLVMPVARWGPADDILHPYRTTGGVPDTIDPANLLANTRFDLLAMGLGVTRMGKAQIAAVLTAERDEVYGFVTIAAEEAGAALGEAAKVLRTM